MFNLQGSELVIILLLALVVLGPEKLPDAMRKLGSTYAQLKKMSNGFQQEFKAAVDEPMREVRETANMLRDSTDFRKLQDGARAEKPKSAEMAPAAEMAPEQPPFPPPSGTPTVLDPGAPASLAPPPPRSSPVAGPPPPAASAFPPPPPSAEVSTE